MSDREFHPLGNEQYKTCPHAWVQTFGPCVKCSVCGATTIISFGGESKPILPPVEVPE